MNPYRLIELRISVIRNFSKGIPGYIAGQHYHRNLVMHDAFDSRRDLHSGLAIRKVVVGDEQVGARRPTCDEIQRLPSVRGSHSVVAVVLEEKRQHLAHMGVVFDQQNGGGLADDLVLLLLYRSRWMCLGFPPERHFNGER